MCLSFSDLSAECYTASSVLLLSSKADQHQHVMHEFQSPAKTETNPDTREVWQSPHLHRAISRCRGKALINWRKLDTPDSTRVSWTHSNERQIGHVPHLHQRHRARRRQCSHTINSTALYRNAIEKATAQLLKWWPHSDIVTPIALAASGVQVL